MKGKILTPKDVSRITGFSLSFVYVHRRELGGVKIGGKLVFHQETLEEILKGGENGSLEKRQKLDVRIPLPRREILSRRISQKDRGPKSRNKAARDIEKTAQRFGLIDVIN